MGVVEPRSRRHAMRTRRELTASIDCDITEVHFISKCIEEVLSNMYRVN